MNGTATNGWSKLRLLSTKDLCRLFRVGRDAIRRWWASGRLPPPYRPSARKHRWPAEVIEATLRRGVGR
jgi:predicted DNA-binding transcriptional regulator AlpA